MEMIFAVELLISQIPQQLMSIKISGYMVFHIPLCPAGQRENMDFQIGWPNWEYTLTSRLSKLFAFWPVGQSENIYNFRPCDLERIN